MKKRVRILGIAPYEGMKALMSAVAADYPQIELTIFVGDMEQGVAAAKNNFHENYDVVVSRGGTAQLLRKSLSLPVVEIDISMYDMLCAMKLANTLTERTALVALANIGSDARLLCEVLGYDIDIFLLESKEQAETTLQAVQERGYSVILCDMITNITAQHMGINSVLITSGKESICRALETAIQLVYNQERLREENLFFRELINRQLSATMLFEEDGTLFLSTLQGPSEELLTLLRQEVAQTQAGAERKITRMLNGMIYSIRARRIESAGKSYIGFFFSSRKSPLPASQTGIRYFTRAEVERGLFNSIFSFAGIIQDYQVQIRQVNDCQAPVMIAGEDGTGKETLAHIFFSRGSRQNNTLVCIDLSQLTEKSWDFLLEHYNSPLADEDNILYFSNIDVVSEPQCRRLMATLREMEVCQRNRVIFSCVCQADAELSAVGAKVADDLCCVCLHMQPLRCNSRRIPTLVKVSLSHLNANSPHQIAGVEPEAMELLCNYSWPHNYTQFRRVMAQLSVTATGPIVTAEQVSTVLRKERYVGSFKSVVENSATPLDLNRTLEEIDQDIVCRVVEECNGNRTEAAKRLGISRTTLWRLLKNGERDAFEEGMSRN